MREERRERAARRLAPVGHQHGRYELIVRRYPALYWAYYFIFAHFTLRLCALVLVVVMPTLFLLWAGFGGPAFKAAFIVISAIGVSMFVGLLTVPRRIQVLCEMPRRVECGSSFTIRYKVFNEGTRPARDLVMESLIYSDYFKFRLRRPGLQWLAPGRSATVEGGGRALARGVYTLPSLRWDSCFPLGFWRWGRTGKHGRTLHIYPSYQRLQELGMPMGPRWQVELHTNAEPTREALEFAGCREYRHGDAMRHVHPRSSARLGVPVVKEYQTSGRSRTALLVDTGLRKHGLREFKLRLRQTDLCEAALSLATSVVEYISRSDNILELLVIGSAPHRLARVGGAGAFDEALDILAEVEMTKDDPLRRIEPSLLDEIKAIQSACLILTHWDETRRKLLSELRGSGMGLKVVLLTTHEKRPVELPSEVETVEARAVMRGEVLAL